MTDADSADSNTVNKPEFESGAVVSSSLDLNLTDVH